MPPPPGPPRRRRPLPPRLPSAAAEEAARQGGPQIAAILEALRRRRAQQLEEALTARAPADVLPAPPTGPEVPPPREEPPPVLSASPGPTVERIRDVYTRQLKEQGTREELGGPGYRIGMRAAQVVGAPVEAAYRALGEPFGESGYRARQEQMEELGDAGLDPTRPYERLAGDLVGTLPAFQASGLVSGPITRSLVRGMASRGVGVGTRHALARAATMQPTMALASGAQATAEAGAHGAPLDEALEQGAVAGMHALDPREPLNWAFSAGAGLHGLTHGLNVRQNIRGRLQALRDSRHRPGPLLPRDAGSPPADINVPLEPPASVVPRETPTPEPRPAGALPRGAPRVLGGTEAELEAARPRRGAPGVLGSGPLAGGGRPELAAGAAGAAVGYATGDTEEDRLLRALAGSTVASASVASLRGARGLHSGPLIGGPEAPAGAPFFSRLGRALESLPESGASPQRLEALSRTGVFAKGEYDFVLAHQLEGFPPEKNIPKADLLRLYERQALRLRATELPEAPDPATVTRFNEVSREIAELSNNIIEYRDAGAAAFRDAVGTAPGSTRWHERYVGDRISNPRDIVDLVNEYEKMAGAIHGSTITWKRGPGNRLIVTLKKPGKPPIRMVAPNDYWTADDVLGSKGYRAESDYLDRSFDVHRPGRAAVNMPPMDPGKKAQLIRDAERMAGDYDAVVTQYRSRTREQDQLDKVIHGKPTVYPTYGRDPETAGNMEANSYREWLFALDRAGPLELPHGWQTRRLEDGQFEVRNQGGQAFARGASRGEAVWNALDAAGETELMRRFHSGHWASHPKDNLFHIRADVRTAYNTASGEAERVLFVREIQSDYFQSGHAGSAGYEGMLDQRTDKIISMPRGHRVALRQQVHPSAVGLPPEVTAVVAPNPDGVGYYALFTRAKPDAPWEMAKRGDEALRVEGLTSRKWSAIRTAQRGGQLEAYASAETAEKAQQAAEDHVRELGAPAAPWRQTEDWLKLAVRHIVQKAVEGGLRHVVWTPGSLNSWAKQHGFAKFYDEVVPRAFKDVGKELGVQMSFEPAPLKRTAVNWKIEPTEADALTPERVALAWKQVARVKPWVIRESQTLREVLTALDKLFEQSRSEYQPLQAGHEPTVTGARLLREIEVGLMEGDYPTNGGYILSAVRGAGLHQDAVVDLAQLRRVLETSGANSASKRHLLAELGLDTPGLPRRMVGALSHEAADAYSAETVKLQVEDMLKQRGMSDQAKVALLHLLGVRRAESFEFGPQYHSVRLPENINEAVGRGFRMYGGIPFDPDWFKAIGLPATGAAVGAAVGAATAGEDESPLGRAAVGAVVGAVGGREISRALKSRRMGRTGAAAVQPVPPSEPAVERRLELVKPEPAAVSEASPAGVAARPGGADVEPPVRPEDYVNFAKLDLDPTGRTRLEAEVERVVLQQGIHPKKVVTWKEVRHAADQLGVDIGAGEQVTVTRKISGARLLAIRNILSANIAAQERWAHELAEPTVLSAERRADILRKSAVLDTQNRHLLEQFVRARSEAGRELNALKIVAKRTLDPAVWWTKARQLAARDLTADELMTVRRLVEERDRAGLVSYVAGLRESPVGEQLTTLWKAGLLTNPKTHVVNITGNTVFAALETAKDPVAAGFDWLFSLRTQQRAKGGLSRYLAGASAQALKKGLGEAGDVLKGRVVGEQLERGELPRETQIDLPGLSPGANALLDGYQKYVFRALGAADRVFFNLALTRSLTEQATLAGKRMGFRGVQLRAYVDGIQRGEGVLADHITSQALKDAAVATFRDQTRLGRAASAFAREVPGGQFIVPFQRTPGAVATRILEYSPLGFGKGVVDAIKLAIKGKDAPAELQRMAAEELGRGLTGSGLIALGYWLADQDLMTGAAPTFGTKDRQLWQQQGRRPNAFHLGDVWVEVGRLSPVGNLLALGANFRKALGGEGVKGLAQPERLGELAAGGLRTVADQPFVTGASQALAALQEPEREAARFVQGLAASTVPAVVGAAARGTDVARVPELEAAGPLRGVAGAVAERIPGARRALPARRDVFGEKLESRGLVNAMFSPATVSPDLRARDEVIREMAEAGYAVPRLPRGKGETASAYEFRQRLFGAATRQAVEQTLQSTEYAAARAAEEQAVAMAAEAAKDPDFARYSPEQLREAILAQLKEQRGANTRAEVLDRAVTRVRTQLRAQLAPRSP